MSSSRGPAETSSPPGPRSAASRSVSRQAARLSGEGTQTQRSASSGSRTCSKTSGSPGIRRKIPRRGAISAGAPDGMASAMILRRPWLSCPIVPSVRAVAGPSDAGRVVTRSDRKVTAASAAVSASGSSSGSRAKSIHSASAPAASKAAASASHSPRSCGCRASTTPTLTAREPSGCVTPTDYVQAATATRCWPRWRAWGERASWQVRLRGRLSHPCWVMPVIGFWRMLSLLGAQDR
jgi:hypothetical protein